jgi:hypothetical protein
MLSRLNNPLPTQRQAPIQSPGLASTPRPIHSAVLSDQVLFSGKGKEQKPNLLKRFWQWLKAIPSQISSFFKKLFGLKPKKKHQPVEVKPTPIPVCHVDPKLAKDPLERQRIATLIAEQTFDDVVKLYQGWGNDKRAPDSHGREFREAAAEIVTEKAQKLLNTTARITKVDFAFDTKPGGIDGTFSPPHSVDHDPSKPRESLGYIHIFPPVENLDLNNPEHRQHVYNVYIHEIQHLVRSYALQTTMDNGALLPDVPAVQEKNYLRHLVGIEGKGAGESIAHDLSKQHPELPDLSSFNMSPLNPHRDVHPDSVQPYMNSLKTLWERTDSPVLSEREKKNFDEFLDHSDPELTRAWVKGSIESELESYMTAFKRAPGLEKNRLYLCDFQTLSQALNLRDYLRHYYQHPRHRVPPDEQNPLAQVRPFELSMSNTEG